MKLSADANNDLASLGHVSEIKAEAEPLDTAEAHCTEGDAEIGAIDKSKARVAIAEEDFDAEEKCEVKNELDLETDYDAVVTVQLDGRNFKEFQTQIDAAVMDSDSEDDVGEVKSGTDKSKSSKSEFGINFDDEPEDNLEFVEVEDGPADYIDTDEGESDFEMETKHKEVAELEPKFKVEFEARQEKIIGKTKEGNSKETAEDDAQTVGEARSSGAETVHYFVADIN